MVQFEWPRHWNPSASSNFDVGRIPFSDNWPSGVIRMGPQYESEEVGNILEQNRLKWLKMVQFECPRHPMLSVSSNFKVEWNSFSPYWPSGVIRMGPQCESEKVGNILEQNRLSSGRYSWLYSACLLLPQRPIMGKGNSSNFKIGWDRGVWVPGAFKLDHLQPFEPTLLKKNYNFLTFILGGHFLLPQIQLEMAVHATNTQPLLDIKWRKRTSIDLTRESLICFCGRAKSVVQTRKLAIYSTQKTSRHLERANHP